MRFTLHVAPRSPAARQSPSAKHSELQPQLAKHKQLVVSVKLLQGELREAPRWSGNAHLSW